MNIPESSHNPGIEQLLPRSCSLAPEEKVPEGFDAWLFQLRGHWQRLRARGPRLGHRARQAHEICDSLDNTSEEMLHERLQMVHAAIRCDPLNGQGRLAEAAGLVGQMVWRTLGLKLYPVQYHGALALHEGLLAEMATGEGKTLTVALAGVLAGYTGRPCHVITANDYLADRDATSMSPIYRACGISVDAVVAIMNQKERPIHYAADVVYVTAKELLADYLRTTLAIDAGGSHKNVAFQHWLAQRSGFEPPSPLGTGLLVRGLHTAIVDEADSVLIDEAVMPLILASPRESHGLREAVTMIGRLADDLQNGIDYQTTLRGHSVVLGNSAKERLAELTAEIPSLWRPIARREELLRQALLVRCFFAPGKHYLVQDGKVVLLDEFTGRLTPGRTLTAGLHQAIEAREQVSITDPNESITQMSFQAFFRRFRRLSGCTGTAWEAAAELWLIYRLVVVRIPTHRPRLTRYQLPRLMRDREQQWQAIINEVITFHEIGRPVLVGLRSVTASQSLAQRLQSLGYELQLLNALEHAQEAKIIAQAGQPRAITIATNMAGRGTDIRLGTSIAEMGGLHVIIAEVNDSGRIDRQLAGRCGRQGDPGSVSSYLGLDDDLALRLIPKSIRMLLAGIAGIPSSWVSWLAGAIFTWAQRRAEGEAFQRRWRVLRTDDWMDSALPFFDRRSNT